MQSFANSGAEKPWAEASQGLSGVQIPDVPPRKEDSDDEVAESIVIVERKALLRDWIVRSVSQCFEGNVLTCGQLSELENLGRSESPRAVLLSLLSMTKEEAEAELARLADLPPRYRTLVLARHDDLSEARAAVGSGANGFISTTARFEIFKLALQCVAAGGTYISAQCLDATQQTAPEAPSPASSTGITPRELEVIKAIRQGKPNKVIAYDLGMCEGTVKAHVRHIMKKLGSRNRTEIAMKGADF